MQITRGYIHTGQKIVIYGPEGIGKTLLASRFPGAVFIDTEGSTRSYDVARFPAPDSWEMLKQEAEYVLTHPGEVGTLVIDTADWAEKLCHKAVCARAGKSGIEDFGYGKGYVYAAEEFGRLLDILDRVTLSGVHVVFTAHAILRKVELPDDTGSYDKWELKCSKQLSPILKEWADMVLFLNYKTYIVQSENGKGKAQGGARMMYTSHRPTYDAKNRFCLPDELPLDYSALEPILTYNNPTPAPAPVPSTEPSTEPSTAAVTPTASPTAPEPVPGGIHPQLASLMEANGVTAAEIQRVVGQRGYFPADMPIDQYPADFIEGCLVAAWGQVFELIQAERLGFQETDEDDLPF